MSGIGFDQMYPNRSEERPVLVKEMPRNFGPCEKCLSFDPYIKYISNKIYGSCDIGKKCWNAEHFHVRCSRCDYEWSESI